MDIETYSRTVDILQESPQTCVSIKTLWQQLRKEGLAQDLDWQTFQNQLSENPRFEVLAMSEDSSPASTEADAILAAIASLNDPQVKLTDRELAPEDIFNGLEKSLTKMNTALQDAWEARPQGDQQTEDQLLDILAASQKLKREIMTLIEQEKKT